MRNDPQGVVETVLHDHRPSDPACPEHPPMLGESRWCCRCGAHHIDVPWRRHVAAAIVHALGHMAKDLHTPPGGPDD